MRWLVCFVMVTLLGGCVQEPPVIEKPNLMVIPESKYLDIELAETNFGRPLRTRPRNPIYFGRLKKEVADTIAGYENTEYFIEYRGELMNVPRFQWVFQSRDKRYEYFIICDKSVTISSLNELIGFDGIVLSFISKCGTDYKSHILAHGGEIDSDEFLWYIDNHRLDDLSIAASNTGSVMWLTGNQYAEISTTYFKANQIDNKLIRECLSRNMINDSIRRWEEQRNSAIKYDIVPDFFEYELSKWVKLLAELRRTDKFELCTASEKSIIRVTHNSNDKLFPILDMLSKSVQDKRRHIVEKMKFPYYNYTFNERYLFPFLYLGQWRVLSSIEDLRGCYTCFHRELYFREKWMKDE